ncbi:MAG: hypothetical protein KGZ65_03590 [Sphingomonadales bacterium]|nr:hypothetical protein [Sphingomonadaceae bacterium]MBS3930293.1 hypothetical protein [Sphingomonadales bacterium]
MAALLGMLVGGTFGVFILYAIWEWALFMRIFDDPMRGKLASVAAAYLSAVIIYGFGSANGGPWNPGGILIYLPGALIVFVYTWRRATKLRENSLEAEAFE